MDARYKPDGIKLGAINSAIILTAAFLRTGDIGTTPVALLGQAYALPILFGFFSQAVAYRQAAKLIAVQMVREFLGGDGCILAAVSSARHLRRMLHGIPNAKRYYCLHNRRLAVFKKECWETFKICSLKINTGSCTTPNTEVSQVAYVKSAQRPQDTSSGPQNTPSKSRPRTRTSTLTLQSMKRAAVG